MTERTQVQGAGVENSKGRAGRTLALGLRLLVAWMRTLYLILGIAAILALSYILGHPQLEGFLSGNDIPWALNMAQWYDRWFPKIPLWFPLQGAGTPLTVLYPPGASLLAVAIRHVTGLSLIQSFRLLGFLSVPLTAAGIYVLVWVKLRSQTTALVAGMLYPLSSGTWDWLVRIGLYAQSVSIMFVPWAFVLFDTYLTDVCSPKSSTGLHRRFAFPAAALVFATMFLFHPSTAVSFAMAVMVYALLVPFFASDSPKPWRSLPRSLIWALAGILTGLLLVAAWLLPLVHANGLANREGLSYVPWNMISYYDFAKTLGLTAPDEVYRMTFAIPVVALAGIGIVASILRRKAPFAWGVLALGSVLFVSVPGFWPGLVRVFERIWSAVTDRAVLIALVFMPAVAAYGARAPVEAVLDLATSVRSRVLRGRTLGRGFGLLLKVFRSGAIAALTLVVAYVALVSIGDLGGTRWGFGPPKPDGKERIIVEDGRLRLNTEPKFTLSVEGDLTARDAIEDFTRRLGLDASTRMDVSPNLGGITEALGLYSDASIINTYAFQTSLIHAMWGYQATVFYMPHYGSPREVDELAKWFGVRYVVLHRDLDPLERYDEPQWSVVFPADTGNQGNVEIREFAQPPALASVLSVPKVLVIGGYQDAVYEQVFRVLTRGGIGYTDALVVEGSHNVDDYSIDELQRFDVLLLHGYGYKNRQRAWGLLEDYVDRGGSLYVDTGWQYWTPDWETKEAPDVLPVKDLVWTSAAQSTGFIIDDPRFGNRREASEFSPLIWEGQPWGVSSASAGLREWGNPVLTVAGTPLIVAGEHGQGKVVWSGMNLIGHIATYDNAAESELLRRLIAWLAPATGNANLLAPVVLRDYPDSIRFVLGEPVEEGTSILWREAYSPDWHASVEIGGRRVKVPIYRAGPGMMLLRLPAISRPGAVIEMDFGFGWIAWAGVGVSLLTAAGLIAVTLTPGIWQSTVRRLRRGRGCSRPRGAVEWLPDKAVERYDDVAGGPEGAAGMDPPQPPRDEVDAKAVGPWAVATELGDAQEVEALWMAYKSGKKVSGESERQADQMIDWWRKTRAASLGTADDES